MDRAPAVCDLEPDPTCAFDRREALPLSTAWLFRRVVAADLASRGPEGARGALAFDAALRVWGAIE